MEKKLTELANEHYYATGEPILRDEEYDLLADTGLEIKNFRNKAKHLQPMGSLKKLKTEEAYTKWYTGGEVIVQPKLDGNSVELIVDASGNIVQAITRGDGYEGSDITNKIHYCNVLDLPENVKCLPFCSIPCEAIIPKKYQKDYEKNLRNVAAGIIGKKEVDRQGLGMIDIVPFESLPTTDFINYQSLNEFFDYLKSGYEYEIDGLVIEMVDKKHKENDLLIPANKVALKFNKEGVDATVGHIEWNLGKYGRLTPVLVLDEPVEIDGTMVGRVSASNYGLLQAAGLGMLAEIKVIKSGDIIPFVSEVVARSDVFPKVFCPNCVKPAVVSDNGVHMECTFCKDDRLTFLKHCFNVLDLEFISDSTIELLHNSGYTSLKDIFELTKDDLLKLDGIGESKANNIISKLGNVKLSEAQVLECAMVQGIGNRQSQRLIDHFGSLDDFIDNCCMPLQISYIDGFGGIMAKRVTDNMDKFKESYEFFSEYSTIKSKELTPTDNKDLGNIVFTGKCEKYDRKELTKILTERGWTVQTTVNKNTNLLLTDIIESNSGKTKKARDLGIEIKTYEEFLE